MEEAALAKQREERSGLEWGAKMQHAAWAEPVGLRVDARQRGNPCPQLLAQVEFDNDVGIEIGQRGITRGIGGHAGMIHSGARVGCDGSLTRRRPVPRHEAHRVKRDGTVLLFVPGSAPDPGAA